MNVREEKMGTVDVVTPLGPLTDEDGAEFVEVLQAHLESANPHVVLNMGEVSYVDSAGLGELVATYTTIRRQGGDVKLLNLTTKMKDLLQITKLLTVFETFEDEGEAVRSLQN